MCSSTVVVEYNLCLRTILFSFYTPTHTGWQYRWFTVDPQTGILSYYLCATSGDIDITSYNAATNTPRGQVRYDV